MAATGIWWHRSIEHGVCARNHYTERNRLRVKYLWKIISTYIFVYLKPFYGEDDVDVDDDVKQTEKKIWKK